MKIYTKPEIKAVELVIAEDIANSFDFGDLEGITSGEGYLGTFSQNFSSLQASV